MRTKEKIRALIVMTLICVFFVSGVLGGVSFHYIRKLIRKRNYSTAYEMLKSSLSKARGRDYYRVLLMLGGIETSLEKAEEYYRKILNGGTSREKTSARVELAKIRYSLGDYSGVCNLLENITDGKVTESYLEGLFFKALALRQLGRFSEARRTFSRIDRGRFLYPGYMALAELDMQDGKIDEAVRRFQMIAAEHSNPVAGFKLGECYEIKGDSDKALIVYRTLIKRFPHSLEASRAREKIAALVKLPQRPTVDISDIGSNEDASRDEEAVYTIQFGAFSDRNNAKRMVDELGKLGIDAWMEIYNMKGTIIYRVRHGKYRNREGAERDVVEFHNRYGLNCRVLPLR